MRVEHHIRVSATNHLRVQQYRNFRVDDYLTPQGLANNPRPMGIV